MAIRHLNYTGRKRINHEDIDIKLERNADDHLSFNVSFDFSSYDFPETAEIYVEAYRQTRFMRFSYGTIANIQSPESTRLTEFDDYFQGIKFRVRITSSIGPKGLELGEAHAIRPSHPEESTENVISLLPVKGSDLGDRIFNLEFDDGPLLLVNKDAGDWHEIVLQPPFQSLAFPEIVRTTLTRIIFIEEYYEVDDLGNWRSQWLNYALTLPGIGSLPPRNNDWAKADWIDDVTGAFCDRFNVSEIFDEYWTTES